MSTATFNNPLKHVVNTGDLDGIPPIGPLPLRLIRQSTVVVPFFEKAFGVFGVGSFAVVTGVGLATQLVACSPGNPPVAEEPCEFNAWIVTPQPVVESFPATTKTLPVSVGMSCAPEEEVLIVVFDELEADGGVSIPTDVGPNEVYAEVPVVAVDNSPCDNGPDGLGIQVWTRDHQGRPRFLDAVWVGGFRYDGHTTSSDDTGVEGGA